MINKYMKEGICIFYE